MTLLAENHHLPKLRSRRDDRDALMDQFSQLVQQRDREALMELLFDRVLDPNGTAGHYVKAVRSAVSALPIKWDLPQQQDAHVEEQAAAPVRVAAKKTHHRKALPPPKLARDGLSHAERLLRFGKRHGGQIRILDFNPFFEEQTGLSAKELAGSIHGSAKKLASTGVLKKIAPGHYEVISDVEETPLRKPRKGHKQPRKGKTRHTRSRLPRLEADDMLQFAARHDTQMVLADYRRDFIDRFGRKPSNGFLAGRLRRHQRAGELRPVGDGVFQLTKAAART